MTAWGKTDRDGGRHHLAHHSADVAAVLEALLARLAIAGRVQAAAQGVRLDALMVRRIVAWAYLHDAGKLSPAFQAKGWPPEQWPWNKASHLDEGVRWFARALRPGGGSRFRPDEVDGWFQALMAHHGRPVDASPEPPRWPRLPHYDWEASEALLLDGLDRWFPDMGGTLPSAPRLHHLFAGLLALADWIGSDRRWFDFVERYDPDYGRKARRRAATALSELGIDVAKWRPEAAPGFMAISEHQPNPNQAAIDAVPGDERLVILEAETGSGKTEAALWRFARLLAEKRVEGLYFALPTRAAAGQIQGRTRDVLQRWLGAASPGATLAVPGLLRVDDEEGHRLPGWEVRWESDGQEGRWGRHWAAEHATRFLTAPVAVGTVDQAMMAGLSVKHAPMRAAALARSLLVVDEVHASDAYMREVLRQLLVDHLAWGGHALLMSATLGSVARRAFLAAALPRAERVAEARRPGPSLAEASAVPYPAVWTGRSVVDVAAPHIGARGVDLGHHKEVALSTLPTMAPEVAASAAVAAARAGARVLVVRNMVSTAVATWKAAVAEAPDLVLRVAGGPALHHARFAAEDRRLLDAAVEGALGKGSPSSPVIVVGSQTLEQALDIDSDFLVTDLCPMDVLLQRIGRLHRHPRGRIEGFGVPRAVVMVPEGGLGPLAEPRFENGLGAWKDEGGTFSGIYLNLAGLEATRRLIEGEPLWCIPAMNRSLVEAATHPEALDVITAEMGWGGYHINVTGKALTEKAHGELVAYSKDGAFLEKFKPLKDDGIVRTRLGNMGALLALPAWTEGPFGQPIGSVPLRADWSRGLSGEEVPEVVTEGNELRLVLPDRAFLYERAGLSRAPFEGSQEGA